MSVASLLVGLALALAAGTALVIALLAIPIDLRFRAERDGGMHTHLRVGWLWGWAGRELETRSDRPATAATRPGKGAWPRLGRLAASRDLIRVGLDLVLAVLDSLEVRHFVARGRYGLGDPAETGMSTGLLWPLLAATEAMPNVEIDLVPDFGTGAPLLEGEVVGDLRARPLALVPPIARIAVSPQARSAARAAWRARR